MLKLYPYEILRKFKLISKIYSKDSAASYIAYTNWLYLE